MDAFGQRAEPMADQPRFEIELVEGRLRCDGNVVPVGKKAFELLRYFVTHPNRTLSNSSILRGVWPDTHVTADSVKQNVKSLRQILRDNPSNPRHIATVRGLGYRYLGGIHVLESSAAWLPDRFAAFHARPAIAVLPFENLSSERRSDYFSDGISEDIMTLLAAWRLCPVIARSSSFVFRGSVTDVRKIAATLSARYVIQGSIRKHGSGIRVTVELSDGTSGHGLWHGSYNGSLEEIFSIQDDIARQIVSSVEPCIEASERARAIIGPALQLDAWDYYLQARGLMHRITPKASLEARTLFFKAINIDPEYADAYAGLSHTYQREVLFETTQDRSACLAASLKMARKAVAMDGESSIAHLAMGSAYIWLNEHELSIAETETAVELNPSNIQAVLALGNRLDIVGRSKEGIRYLEHTLKFHPRDPYSHIYFAQLARAHINQRNYETALGYLYESIRRKPDYPHTYHVMAICLGHLGRYEEARAAANRCNSLHPGFIQKRARWNIYIDSAANEHLAAGLIKAGISAQ